MGNQQARLLEALPLLFWPIRCTSAV